MDVAVVSMQGVFPSAESVEELWRNVKNGEVSIHEYPPTNQVVSPNDIWVHRRPLLSRPEYFDADFFGLSGVEAEALDPQLRLLMEQSWLALEQAGACDKEQRLRTGIFSGLRHSRYLEQHLQYSQRHHQSLGSDYLQMINRKDSAATFLAYHLGLGGPAISVNTACSTSLLAVHLACNSLITWECDVALAGAAAIPTFGPESQKAIPGGFLSPDGYCRPFSEQANGTIDGAGVAVVALKRLEDALKDGNKIHAVIQGSAVNNDGNDKVGYSAPSISGQARVITEALEVAEVDVENIGYIETHGTGTQLGDSIEVRALDLAWKSHTQKKNFCSLGSIKANIGHLGVAAGVTGLIKACCAVRDGVIPPLVHCEKPNPAFALGQTPFRIPQKLEPWGAGERLAAVSSFGIGGTNAHLIIKQPPLGLTQEARTEESALTPSLLLISAKTPTALQNQCRQVSNALELAKNADLPGYAATLAKTRSSFPYRVAVSASSITEARTKLQQCDKPAGIQSDPKVLLTFPGQGSQHPEMTLSLYQNNPTYRRYLDSAAALMRANGGGELLELLSDSDGRLNQTQHAQPCLFATSWALAKCWEELGVSADLMLGHSVGEWVAASLAGVFSFEDAMRLVCLRGRLMQKAKPGRMMSVISRAEKLESWLPAGVEIAVINQPDNCVVAGSKEQLEAFSQTLNGLNISYSYLHTSHAFHTSDMQEAAYEFERELAKTQMHSPKIDMLSNLTGEILTPDQATSSEYWARHIRCCVQFSKGMDFALASGVNMVIECGPGNVLTTLVSSRGSKAHCIASQPHVSKPSQSHQALIDAVGKAWQSGLTPELDRLMTHPVDLTQFSLPGYAFDRKRHWVEASNGALGAGLDEVISLIISNNISLSSNDNQYHSHQDIRELLEHLMTDTSQQDRYDKCKEAEMTQTTDSIVNDDSVEQKITAIWQEVLALPSIKSDESFFDLGGNSLWALQIVSKVNAEFGCEIQLTELLQADTIKDLRQLVENKLFSMVSDTDLDVLLGDLEGLSEQEMNDLLQKLEEEEK
ncbi:beta-ketoacyl synthase N-terminal-like domain-containing protein [Vibrio vulnificus]